MRNVVFALVVAGLLPLYAQAGNQDEQVVIQGNIKAQCEQFAVEDQISTSEYKQYMEDCISSASIPEQELDYVQVFDK